MVPVSISLADIYARRTALQGKLTPDSASQKLVTDILALVTSRDYSRVPRFERRGARSNVPFRATARPSKLGFERGLDEVRKLFNKLTGSKASVLLPVLAKELENLRGFADFSESAVLVTIFGIVCSTPFYSRMYAQYYSELASSHSYLTSEIARQILVFEDMTKNITAIDPNVDYDGFCETNKLNGRRQALGKFLMGLCEYGALGSSMKVGIALVCQLLRVVLGEFNKLSLEDGKKDECAILADLCGSLVLDNRFVIGTILGGPLHDTIVETSLMQVSDRASLSNKSIFKFMDLKDNLRTADDGFQSEDLNHDSELYTMHIGSQTATIALGKVNETFNDRDVLYYPIYEMAGDFVSRAIGVFEITPAEQMGVSGPDGLPNIDRLGQPLFYDEDGLFAPPSDGEADEMPLGPFSPLDEQAAEAAKLEEDSYKPRTGEPWIAKFMRNSNFELVSNEGGGDCLFAAIRDGLQRVGNDTTVEQLRKTLADEADQATFEEFQNLSLTFAREVQGAERDLKALTKTHQELERRAKETSDFQTKTNIVQEARKVEVGHSNATAQRSMAAELADEYRFMKNITNLQEFKAVIQTCEFWGETWAISTLERMLNIKLILLSHEAYNTGDMDNVLLCGQLNDDKLSSVGEFRPDYYIMLDYFSDHYQLITYKRRGAFSFAEIPYAIKRLVVVRCMEQNAGPYALIPEFQKFATEEVKEQSDDKPVFQVYEKSSKTIKPGKGVGETIQPARISKYAKLAAIPEWRRKLSTAWTAPIAVDGHTWNTVDHYVHAGKFQKTNPEFYLQFTIDHNADTALAKNSAMARATTTSGKYAGKRVRPAGVVVDPTISQTALQDRLRVATAAKFKQHPDLMDVLKLTDGATLLHYERAKPPRRMTELESQRDTE